MEQEQSSNLFDLHVDHRSTSYLNETARWAKFLAIVGFVSCGILVLVAIFAGSFLAGAFGRLGTEGAALGGAMLSTIYILIALVNFFPCFYLFNFASKMQMAIRSNDQEKLSASFSNLKSCFKFVGIMTVIVLSFYGLILIFAVFSAGFR